jgi:hypothetical protein
MNFNYLNNLYKLFIIHLFILTNRDIYVESHQKYFINIFLKQILLNFSLY